MQLLHSGTGFKKSRLIGISLNVCFRLHSQAMDTLHSFSGEIIVIDTWNDSEAELNEKLKAAENALSGKSVVALDLEWTPDFDAPGPDGGNPVALIQLAIPDKAFLLRTPPGYTLPTWLTNLLVSESVTKIAVGFDYCDTTKLLSSFGLKIPRSSVCDLSDLARERGVAQRGFKSLCFYFDYYPRKSRTISMSSWGSSERLSPAQVSYAAEDAWFCLLLASRLNETSTESLDEWLVTGKFEKREDPVVLGKRKRSLSSQILSLPIGNDKLSVELIESVTELFIREIFESHPVGVWLPEPPVLIAIIAAVAGNCKSADAESWAALKDKLSACPALEVSWDGEALHSIYRVKKHHLASSAERMRRRIQPLFESHAVSEDLVAGAEHVAAGSKEEDEFFFSAVAKMKESIDSADGKISDLKLYRKKELSKFIRNLRVNR